MGYEAILFDMDGVVVDTYQSVTEFWQNIAKTYQVHLTQADFNQHVYGCPATHTLAFLFPHLNAGERQSVLAKMADYETNLIVTLDLASGTVTINQKPLLVGQLRVIIGTIEVNFG